MAKSNKDRVGTALDLFVEGMQPFVEREMKARHKDEWQEKIREVLRSNKSTAEKASRAQIPWDAPLIVNVINSEWQYLFRNKLGKAERGMLHELSEIRNRWAHQEAFSTDDTWRALDTIHRLLSSISAGDEAAQVDRLKADTQHTRSRELARQETRRAQKEALAGTPTGGLRPWRDVVTPHPDVASGRFAQAEFAADLAQVIRGDATDEYGNPKEFFRRTFITDGLRGLLLGAINRLTGNGGDPVIELQTNFGGGKTHSMLALYHLVSGTSAADLPGIDVLLNETEATELPTAKRAVLVGTALSAGQAHKKPDGTLVHTLWGEMAWQLLGKEGYAIVADSDKNGTSPGSDILSELFAKAGPTLILIDEWVAYIRQTYETPDLPGGSFDSNLTFAQSLTEAAKSPNVLVVASLPQSRIEVGGEGGQKALDILENTFTRVKSSWRPASQEESYEIVRRRLFESIEPDNLASRDAVIDAYMQLYKKQEAEFPSGCRDGDYRRKVELAYPVHPELFERLYTDWASLEEFQRTRGVLRLMATVIYSLWEGDDKSLMIMPAMIPMDDSAILSEITTKSGLSPAWTSVIETDVDGNDSLSRRIDRDNPNLGRLSACRRVARTIYVGSAPIADTARKGVDDRRIKLGCVQPGEGVAVFGDALRRLTDQATHLYVDGSRYWYSTQPSVTRVAQDRAAEQAEDDVLTEIRTRLAAEQKHAGDFERVHACPDSGADVPDDPEGRLVILKPESPHIGKNHDSPALQAAQSILEQRGNSPRIYRNTLVFAAADRTRLVDLDDAVRKYLAWKSIYADRTTLNLDPFQTNQAKTKFDELDGTVQARIPETYQWLLVPVQPEPTQPVQWQTFKAAGADRLPVRASKKLISEELFVTQYAGVRLRMDLDRVPLWRGNHVGVKQLCEDMAQYLYLPRFRNQQVIVQAMIEGVSSLSWSTDTFAVADAFDPDRNRYLGLRAVTSGSIIADGRSVLVKPDVASAQIGAEKTVPWPVSSSGETADGTATSGAETTGDGEPEEAEADTKSRRFFGAIPLDAGRLGRDAGRVAEEVLSHLTGLPGATASVTMEIQIEIPEGVPDNVVRTVMENCRTLKFSTHDFESD